LREDRLDVFYSPVTAFPLNGVSRRIVTIHDFAWHEVPESYSALDRFRQRRWVALAARCADRIVTVSESTRQRLLSLFPLAAGKTVVIPPGVDDRCFEETPRRELERVRARYGLDGRYIFTLASAHPRKNLLRLIEAYELLREQTPERTLLLVAGRGGSDSTKVLSKVNGSRFARDILLAGYVPQEDLLPLHTGADLLVFPSRSEGFGIPVLEAMACGTPVLVSDLPVFREVCGETAIRVNPLDPSALAKGMARSLRDEPERAGRVREGIKRARAFRWETSARKLQELFHETVEVAA